MSVVGGLFSDVFKSQGMSVPGAGVDWSKAGGNPAELDWNAIKPFQVMPPMSWAATNKDATAPEEAQKRLDGIANTDNRSEYQKWLDSQNQSKGGGEGGRDRTGGLAGNGTNFTDKQWDSIKAMNDEYGFMGNPVNQIGLGAAAKMMMPGAVGLFGLSNENPFTAQQRSVDAINSWNTMQAAQRDAFANPAFATGTPEAASLAAQYSQGGPSVGVAQPNATMSMADQYSSYGSGREAAESQSRDNATGHGGGDDA